MSNVCILCHAQPRNDLPFPSEDDEGAFCDAVLETKFLYFLDKCSENGMNSGDFNYANADWMKMQKKKWKSCCYQCWLKDDTEQ